MSAALLYHAFGMKGYEYESTQFVEGKMFVWVSPQRDTWRCSACGSAKVIGHGHHVRPIRSLPIGSKAVWLMVRVPRVACAACGKTRRIQLEGVRPRHRTTRAFERYVIELSRLTTFQGVARHLGISWDMVKDIQKRHLGRHYARPKLKHLRRLAIDELHIGRGGYLTLLLDLDSGRVVFVGHGKGAAALGPFWKRLRASHARIQAVAMDMNYGYINAVTQHLPKAAIVFDRFHIVKLFNEKLSDLRRALHREATDKLHKSVLKGTRWLLLKNPEHLNDRRQERQRLEQALRMNAPLATAYYLKEDLRQLWEQGTKSAARRFLQGWMHRAESSGIRIVQKFAKTLAAFRSGILAWYDHPISTGALEGTNNKIRTMQRQAYGYRDLEFFILKTYALHETTYALIG